MKRWSPDAGRRRARRRDEGAVLDPLPLCAAGVVAAATMVLMPWVAPTPLSAMASTKTDTCLHTAAPTTRDTTRG